MILLRPEMLREYRQYYGRYMSMPEFVRGLLTIPRRATLTAPLPELTGVHLERPASAWWPAHKPFFILFKPGRREWVSDECVGWLQRESLRVEELFPVFPMWRVLERLYEGGGALTRWVVALYRDDAELRTRHGFAVIVSATETIDLISLKERFRRRAGFVFYVVKGFDESRFLGLNAIHIADPERMTVECAAVREYRQAV